MAVSHDSSRRRARRLAAAATAALVLGGCASIPQRAGPPLRMRRSVPLQPSGRR